MHAPPARSWRSVTGAVALVALLLQLGLVVCGAAVRADTDPPELVARIYW